MADKVVDGTPEGSKSLCNTCRWALVGRGLNLQEFVHCNMIGKNFTFKVERCSGYDDKTRPSLNEMKQIAWKVESRNRGPVGFQGSELEIEITPPRINKYGNPED